MHVNERVYVHLHVESTNSHNHMAKSGSVKSSAGKKLAGGMAAGAPKSVDQTCSISLPKLALIARFFGELCDLMHSSLIGHSAEAL